MAIQPTTAIERDLETIRLNRRTQLVASLHPMAAARTMVAGLATARVPAHISRSAITHFPGANGRTAAMPDRELLSA